jgi:threonine dehydrogenase-like Zn-dependent dehydrogenase
MRAVSFAVSVPGFLLGKGLGRVTETAVFGPPSGLRYGEVGEPGLPGRDWVRLEVLKAGICGTDIGTLTFEASPAMEPFGSFPAVLGHEVLARVIEAGPAVQRVQVGQRVAVDPVISCTIRGFGSAARCASCVDGRHGTCERAGEEGEIFVGGRRLRRGLTIGFHADLPGVWGERMIAHESQVFPVDDRLSDRTAALLEPLAVGMHAALGTRPFGPGPALVIGSGPIALGAIWALRAAGYEGELLAQIKRGHEADIARALGASEIAAPGDEARQALVETGAQGYMPLIGDEVYAGGGFPLIFDCVGSAETVKQSLRFAAPRGRIVMLGCAAEIRKLDLTFVWARELEIKGFVCYGDEEWRGARRHTFEVTQEMLLETGAPVERMVTHVFPLAQYREALSAATNRRRSGSIKVLLDPSAG